jgi:CRP-like cAMP-binding protein
MKTHNDTPRFIAPELNFSLRRESGILDLGAERLRRHRGGEIILSAGEVWPGLLQVLNGQVKIKRQFASGEFLECICGEGDWIGLSEASQFMAEGSATMKSSLEAVGEVLLRLTPASEFAALMAQTPPMVQQLLLQQEQSRALGTQAFESQLRRPLDQLPVRARVAAVIWGLARRHADRDAQGRLRVDLDLTREEIAHLAGTVYESVIRTLTQLKKEGVLEVEGRQLTILKQEALARIGQVVLASPPEERGQHEYEHLQRPSMAAMAEPDSRRGQAPVRANHSESGRTSEAEKVDGAPATAS